MHSWLGFGLTVAVLTLGACGGSGGEALPGPPPDVSGWWLEEVDEMDAPDGYTANRLVHLVDDGSTVTCDYAMLAKDGWALSANDPNGTNPTRWEWAFDILSDTHIEGTEEYYLSGVREYGTHLRLTRAAAPDGWLVMSGTVRGRTVDVDTATAFAAEFDDRGAWTVLSIHEGGLEESAWVWLILETTPPIPTGTYTLGPAAENISVIAFADGRSEYGDTGTASLIESSSTRVAGWFTVDLVDGGSISGNFDVPVRVNATWD